MVVVRVERAVTGADIAEVEMVFVGNVGGINVGCKCLGTGGERLEN